MTDEERFTTLANEIKSWARELGFQQCGIALADLGEEKQRLDEWLARGYHGEMHWLAEHRGMKTQPTLLLEGTIRAISVRMDYLPPDTEPIKILKSPEKAYISRYALGRDYHKLIRKRLAVLAKKIEAWCEQNLPEQIPSQRPFVDSAPVMERPLAQQAGLGWVGKHTLLINKKAGSWFFLGEIYTNLPLPFETEKPVDRCGTCEACLKVCPTDAFPKPYQLDARRCISYLTIEYDGVIPEEFREPIGNRVFGCDDCQAICPWNKYAKPTCEKDFHPRHGLDSRDLLTLFEWDEATFLKNTAGSPIRRTGYRNWQRNLAIGLGNAPSSDSIIAALEKRLTDASPVLAEHIQWAIRQQRTPDRKRKRKVKQN